VIRTSPDKSIPAAGKYFFAALLILLFVTTQSQVSNSNFDHFTIKEGLPSEQIYNCYQDREGFLWIGTDAGVSRFDGKVFKNYNIDDGLGDNEIHEVYQDAHNRIWFFPFSGKLSYYYKGKIYIQDIAALSEGASLGATSHILLAEDLGGNFYLSRAGSTKIIKMAGITGKPSVYNLSGLLEPGEVFTTFFGNSRNQAFCISSRNRLIALGDSLIKDVTPAGFLKEESPGRFYPNHQLYTCYLLFSGKKGIYELRDSTARLLIPNEKMPLSNYTDFLQVKYDRYHNLWLNHLYYNTRFYKFSNGRYEEGVTILDSIFSLTTCDNENNIWFSANDGLYKTTYAKIHDKTTFDINHNLLARKIISCAIDKDSGLWLGYSNGYISRIKGKSVVHYNLKIERRTNNRIVQIKITPTGNVLIGTDETVALSHRLKAGEYSSPSFFKKITGEDYKCSTKNIFLNSRGEAFLAEPFYNRLLWLDERSLRVRQGIKSLNVNSSRRFSSFFDKQNRLYTSTIDGFIVLENGIFTNLAARNESFKVRIQDYAESPAGIIFLATYNNGLIAMKDKEFICAMPRFNDQTVICRRICLKDDTLYVATNCGIAVLVFTENKFRLIKMVSGSDGLISVDVNDLAFSGNRLFAATSHGVSSFETIHRRTDPMTAPTLVLSNIQADDKTYPVPGIPDLSYKTKLIRINFIAPVLNKPELTLYRYRFNPSDNWQVTSANFIEFSKLKPGSYGIVLQAKRYNSDWSTPEKLNFRITPPFYSTVWFILFAILALATSLFLVIRSFLGKKFREQLYVLQQKEAVEKERNRIAADIHDDIGAELTNIAILSRVLKFSTDNEKNEALKIVDKIESSSQQVITKMNEVIWTLNAKNYTLKNLMAHIRNYVTSLRENTGMNVDLFLSEITLVNYPLTAEFTGNVFLVVKELLQNAVKHSQADNIKINFNLHTIHNLHIQYTDSGVGFDIQRETQGNGLKNVRRRVAESKGVIEIFSEKNKGCEITVTFPLKDKP